ncbi:Cytokinin glycosidase [Parasponia andersonii]|uniref:Cytokinin glycosidase n=1 Tax=Parasponia andersonii TaxID=3476 RepID=A0A2P5D2R9_PARAD|nr:Cytokinin glycosidase [Parasponia andersonii]
MQQLLRSGCSVTFGVEAVLATTIPPYCSDLAFQEMSRLHNLAFLRRYISKFDIECFIAIFLSTLFSLRCV